MPNRSGAIAQVAGTKDTPGDGDEAEMRRSNKASSATQAKKRTTHLDLPSHDDVPSSKIHKRNKGPSMIAIARAILCGLAALGTLFYVSNKVFESPGENVAAGSMKDPISSSHSIPQKERFLDQQNRLLPPDSIYRTKVEDIHGDWQQLMQYSGSVSLVINVACE